MVYKYQEYVTKYVTEAVSKLDNCQLVISYIKEGNMKKLKIHFNNIIILFYMKNFLMVMMASDETMRVMGAVRPVVPPSHSSELSAPSPPHCPSHLLLTVLHLSLVIGSQTPRILNEGRHELNIGNERIGFGSRNVLVIVNRI